MENLDSPTGTAELEMGVATINVGINWNVLQKKAGFGLLLYQVVVSKQTQHHKISDFLVHPILQMPPFQAHACHYGTLGPALVSEMADTMSRTKETKMLSKSFGPSYFFFILFFPKLNILFKFYFDSQHFGPTRDTTYYCMYSTNNDHPSIQQLRWGLQITNRMGPNDLVNGKHLSFSVRPEGWEKATLSDLNST